MGKCQSCRGTGRGLLGGHCASCDGTGRVGPGIEVLQAFITLAVIAAVIYLVWIH